MIKTILRSLGIVILLLFPLQAAGDDLATASTWFQITDGSATAFTWAGERIAWELEGVEEPEYRIYIVSSLFGFDQVCGFPQKWLGTTACIFNKNYEPPNFYGVKE